MPDLTALLRTFDDPILKQVCEPIAPADAGPVVAALRGAMDELANAAVGLAAPQIGFAVRVIAVRQAKHLPVTIMLNPEITKFSSHLGSQNEGCLSYPKAEGWSGVAQVVRFKHITVKWTSPEGGEYKRKFVGYEARIIQHELDHLNGICLVGEAWRAARKETSLA